MLLNFLNKPWGYSENNTGTLFACCVLLFVLSSTRELYYTEYKIILDILRLGCVSLIVLINAKLYKTSAKFFILALVLIFYCILTGSIFVGQILLALLLSFIFMKRGFRDLISPAITWSIFAIAILMGLSILGVIDSSVGYNPLSEENNIVIGYKYDWGFWHPNIISHLLSGCVLASFYLGHKKQFFWSSLLYIVVLTETVSRTYFVMLIVLMWYFIFYIMSAHRSYVYLISMVLMSLVGSIVAVSFLVPEALEVILGEELYGYLNASVSMRLSIAQESWVGLSHINKWLGFHWEGREIDSFFVSLSLMIGIAPTIILLIILNYLVVLCFRRGLSKEVLLLATFIVLANFEKISGISSIFFITVCYIIIFVLQGNREISVIDHQKYRAIRN